LRDSGIDSPSLSHGHYKYMLKEAGSRLRPQITSLCNSCKKELN